MKLYHRDEIARAVPLDGAALNAITDGFLALGQGRVVQPPILSMAIEEANGEVDVKTAHIQGLSRFAIKVSPGFFDNPSLGLPSLNGLVIVFSARTGVVEAVLFDEGYLTDVRTALAGAVAANALSRPDSQRVTVIGAGMQARLQVEALTLVRDIRQVDIWARDTAKARAWQDDVQRRLGLAVQVHAEIADACCHADIIVTTTPARTPVLFGDMLPSGVHVTAMGSDSPGKQELDRSVMERADHMVVDTRAQSEHNGELKAWAAVGEPVPLEVTELGVLLAEGAPGREGDQAITVCDLTGTGVQDTAIADFALSRLA